MSTESDNKTMEECLKALDTSDLNHHLNQVLTELRSRESEQIKKDILTHSKSLRLQTPIEQFQA